MPGAPTASWWPDPFRPPLLLNRRGALGVIAAVSLGGSIAARGAIPAQTPVVPARTVRNGWGICGRPGIDAAPEAYAAMMGAIGTRNLRCPIADPGTPDRLLALRRAMRGQGPHNTGPRITGLVTAYLNDPRTTWASQQPILLALAREGLLAAIEGPNEINNPATGGGAHGPDDTADHTSGAEVAANARAWAQALARFRQANAQALAGVVLVGPSIASGLHADYAAMPALTGLADAGNMHFYAGGGRQPSFSIPPNPEVGSFASVYAWARAAMMPQGRMWLTETGASTSGNYAPDGISQARYLANQLLDFFAAGGERLFIYQLVDGSGRTGDVEGNFGLFHRDDRPKPAAVMLGHLKQLLSLGSYDNPANDTDTGPLMPGYDPGSLSLEGPPGVATLLLAKSDGTSLLAVWNEPPIDDGHGTSLVPAPTRLQLDFGSPQTFSVHDLLGPQPLSGTTPSGRAFDTARTVAIELRGSPLLIELRRPAP